MLKVKLAYMVWDEFNCRYVAVVEFDDYKKSEEFVLNNYALFEFSEREDFSLTPVTIYSN